jgi:hypothetical protein
LEAKFPNFLQNFLFSRKKIENLTQQLNESRRGGGAAATAAPGDSTTDRDELEAKLKQQIIINDRQMSEFRRKALEVRMINEE